MPHELPVTARQKTKRRNAFTNKISTDIQLSKAQLSNIIQLRRFLDVFLGKLAGPLVKVAALLAKNVLAPLVATASASAIDGDIQRKIRG